MLSRVADSIYWMSRYIERAENVARFIGVNLSLTLDTNLVLQEQWDPLLYATGDFPLFYENHTTEASESTSEAKTVRRHEVISFLTFDEANPNSIYSCINKARDNARLVRGYISTEMWEQINKLYHLIRDEITKEKILIDPINFYMELRMAIYTMHGLTDSTFSRDDGWCFQQLGMYLERADKTTRILDVKYFILLPRIGHVGSVVEDILWAALLQSVSGFQTYKQKYNRLSPEHVVEFLLLDREFPRSVLYCLKSAEESLFRISGTHSGYFSNSAEQKIARLRNELEYSRVDEIIIQGLHEYLEQLKSRINCVGEDVYHAFFKYPEVEYFSMVDQ